MAANSALKNQLLQLLAISSNTGFEKEISCFIQNEIQKAAPQFEIKRAGDSFIAVLPDSNSALPKIALVGHLDVVPTFFKPYVEGEKVHGAGASDMKSALAVMLFFIKTALPKLLEHVQLSFVFYACEEATPLKENGLYALRNAFPDYFCDMDLAIVGEPTNNTLQVGCVGSLHAEVSFFGQACHSARPWEGENAVYKALPFLEKLKLLTPQRVVVFNQPFFEIIELTVSHSEPGSTTLPGYWKGNVNFRFSPDRSMQAAIDHFIQTLKQLGGKQIKIVSQSPAGKVIETPLFKRFIETLNLPVKPKQAWTDVAQFSQMNIPAFNYGPGLAQQCHKNNEYVLLDDMVEYSSNLERSLKAF